MRIEWVSASESSSLFFLVNPAKYHLASRRSPMTTHNLNTAEYEYAVPETIEKDAGPVPQQVPKRFCVLLLKGACTEFTDCPTKAKRIISWCWLRGHGITYLLFKYSDELGRYEASSEDQL